LAKLVAEGINAFFSAGLFLVPARTAECGVIAARRQGVEQGTGLQQSAAFLGTELQRAGAIVDGLPVDMDDQFGADRFREFVPELDHFTKLVRRVDMQEREGNAAGIESFLGQAHHARGVLADRIQHDRVGELGGDFANNVNALGFEKI
jgi:hypothetical protein